MKRFCWPLRNTENISGTTTTPLPHKSTPLILLRSSSWSCRSLRKGKNSRGRQRLGSKDVFNRLSPSWNVLGVERDLHSTTNVAIRSPHDASTSASKPESLPAFVSSFNKRKEIGGRETFPIRSCSIISLSVGIFLSFFIFLTKKIPFFRKVCKQFLLWGQRVICQAPPVLFSCRIFTFTKKLQYRIGFKWI